MSSQKVPQKPLMSTARVFKEFPKMTKQEAARELVRIVERDMESKGLSEKEKDSRVKAFTTHVDSVSANRAK